MTAVALQKRQCRIER